VVAHEHPEWLLGDAGRNWGQQLLGLDLTHPGVRDYLAASVRRLADLGVDYFKLDFLYAGAGPGRRHDDVSPVAAYRSGLELIREAAGPEAYLLACGAPILPSVGLVDAMRVSPDTFHEGGEDGSRGLRGRMSLVARAWQQGRFWVNDPDSLVARPGYRLREPWAETVEEYGGLRSFSDRVAELDDWGLATTRRLMTDVPGPGPLADEVVARSLAAAADTGADTGLDTDAMNDPEAHA
jgi:alpha-galactosidase